VPVLRSPRNASAGSSASPLPDPKLLLDENLASSLVGALSDLYPGSAHVANVGLAAARDRVIWTYAAANDFVLVTKDEDFQRLSILQGAPPKVIWIGLGNCSTADVERPLRSRHGEIVQFLEHPEATFLALG
jgi:predicted nuclease of predicted toxin-antitoxin system